MKTLARIVTRLQGEGDGLFVGVTMKGHDYFEPNTVYEIVELFGEILIRKIGDSCVAHEGQRVDESPIRQTWANDIGYVVGVAGPQLFLSRDEFAGLCKAMEDERERDI